MQWNHYSIFSLFYCQKTDNAFYDFICNHLAVFPLNYKYTFQYLKIHNITDLVMTLFNYYQKNKKRYIYYFIKQSQPEFCKQLYLYEDIIYNLRASKKTYYIRKFDYSITKMIKNVNNNSDEDDILATEYILFKKEDTRIVTMKLEECFYYLFLYGIIKKKYYKLRKILYKNFNLYKQLLVEAIDELSAKNKGSVLINKEDTVLLKKKLKI